MTKARKSLKSVLLLSGLLLAIGSGVFLLDYLSWYHYILWVVVCFLAPLAVVVATGWVEEDL